MKSMCHKLWDKYHAKQWNMFPGWGREALSLWQGHKIGLLVLDNWCVNRLSSSVLKIIVANRRNFSGINETSVENEKIKWDLHVYGKPMIPYSIFKLLN